MVFRLPYLQLLFLELLEGFKTPITQCLIAITGAVANIVLDIVFVYGIEDLFLQCILKVLPMLVLLLKLLWLSFGLLFIKKTDIPLLVKFPFNPEIKRFAIMIVNLFIRTLALNVALYFGTSFATKYGANYIAAYTIAINLWFLGAFLIDGYASAGNILSGKLLGAKDYKNLIDLSNKLIKYGIIIGLIIGIIGAVFYYPLGDLFSNDERF